MVDELLNRVLTTTVVQKVIDEIKANGGKWAEEVDIDPVMAVETIQGVIRSCPDPKQLRMLMGTFVQQITVSNKSVVVEYHEDALLRSPAPTVHSGVRWLLNLGSNQGPTD